MPSPSQSSSLDTRSRTEVTLTLASILHPRHKALSNEGPIPIREVSGENAKKLNTFMPLGFKEYLIELFFQNVRPIVSIYHQPSFHRTHLGSSFADLHLFAMFSLAVRYLPDEWNGTSTAEYRHSAPAFHRAALEITEQRLELPSLEVLQALVLITIYEISLKISAHEYQRVILCSRIASDLRLNAVDAEEWAFDAEDWIRQEEKRRLWWAIWEMEAFVKIAYLRSAPTSEAEILTLLPASEDRWFSGQPEFSVYYHRDPLERWRILQKGGKSDPRSYHIVIISMMLHALQLGSKSTYYSDMGPFRRALESFEATLPSNISSVGRFSFTKDRQLHNVLSVNIHILIQTYNIPIITPLILLTSSSVTRYLHRRAWSEDASRDQLIQIINGKCITDEKDVLRAIAWKNTIQASDKVCALFEQIPISVPYMLGPYIASAVFSATSSQVVAQVFSIDQTMSQLANHRRQVLHSALESILIWWGTDRALLTRLAEINDLLHWWREQMPTTSVEINYQSNASIENEFIFEMSLF